MIYGPDDLQDGTPHKFSGQKTPTGWVVVCIKMRKDLGSYA